MKMFDPTAPTRELRFNETPRAPGPARTVVYVPPTIAGISPTWLLLAFALGLLVSGLFR
jgi:hypothetical protein